MIQYIEFWVESLYRLCRRYWIRVCGMIVLLTTGLYLWGQVHGQNDTLQDLAEEYADTYGTWTYYNTRENLSDDQFYLYLDEANQVYYSNLLEFRQKLLDEKSWQYTPFVEQFIEVVDMEVPAPFLYGYESGWTEGAVQYIEEYGKTAYFTKAIQVSDCFFDLFSISVKEGRRFAEEDYEIKEGQPVPVLLGNDYEGVLSVGDTFQGYYFFMPVTFQVAGFLEDHSFFYSETEKEFLSCGRYVIIPAFLTGIDSESERMMLLGQIGGILASDQGYPELKETYDRLKKECGLERWQMGIADPNRYRNIHTQMSMYQSMSDEVLGEFRVILWLVLGFIVISQVFVVCGLIRAQYREYGIHLLCGASFGMIGANIIGLVCLILVVSDGMAVFLLWMLAHVGWSTIGSIQLIVAVIGVVLIGVPLLYLKHTQVGELIGGRE